MAFTRRFLSSLGIDEEKIDTIITAHAEVVDALKDEVKQYKDDAEKLPDVQKKLDDALENDGYKEKYTDLKKEYDEYKAEITEKESLSKKTNAYKALLKDAGIADKRLDTVLKVDADIIKRLEFDDKGHVKNAEDVEEQAKKSWADFIVTEETHGSDPAQPPTNNGGGDMTKEQIMSIKDTQERQKAIMENSDLFR